MVSPLPLLGCSRFHKLIQPLSIRHDKRLSHGGPPCEGHGSHSALAGVWVRPNSVLSGGDGILVIGTIPIGCFFDPASQGRLRLLSGMPQRAMEPLKIATGFLSWEKAPTAQKHFVVILGGATQFHLGGKLALALQQPSLGTLVPQLAKFGLGVATMDELVRMKWTCFIQEVVQVRLHLIQVRVFRVPYFGDQLGGDRPFLHTLFLVVF